ncbi:MAG: nucleotidyltransferase domain-containing protein [Candidatus Riflebacteria bacterium]|nr:nucleotidyltransferase domain-containing protein [Candidatus Riflebacteria bacterium]
MSWQANLAYPAFPDLQALVRKTCGIPALLQRAWRPLQRAIRRAMVHGSVARGEAPARSDVDLLLVGSLSLDEAVAALAPVEACIAREVGIRLFSSEEFRHRRQAG